MRRVSFCYSIDDTNARHAVTFALRGFLLKEIGIVFVEEYKIFPRKHISPNHNSTVVLRGCSGYSGRILCAATP